MKTNKRHETDWEKLERKWKSQLTNREDELSEDLWQRLSDRLDEKEEQKKGFVWSFSSIRWVAAASAALLMVWFWQQGEEVSAPVEVSVVVKTEKPKVMGSGSELKEQIFEPEAQILVSKQAPVKKQLRGGRPIEATVPKQEVVAVEPEEILMAKAEDMQPKVVAVEEKPVEKADRVNNEVVDEMLVVVDIEPVKKEKAIKKVLGFLQKVKKGKWFELGVKPRQGKLNDEIHQVVYKYEEKEEKIKNLLSL